MNIRVQTTGAITATEALRKATLNLKEVCDCVYHIVCQEISALCARFRLLCVLLSVCQQHCPTIQVCTHISDTFKTEVAQYKQDADNAQQAMEH